MTTLNTADVGAGNIRPTSTIQYTDWENAMYVSGTPSPIFAFGLGPEGL